MPDHYWVRYNIDAADIIDEPVEERMSGIRNWDPFSMPINFYASLKVRGENYNNIVNYSMPAGGLIDATMDKEARLVGLWRNEGKELLGCNEVTFDPALNNMPVRMVIRLLKDPDDDIDRSNAFERTSVYQINETKWFKHESGKYLPKQVDCVCFRNGPRSWRIKMDWWLDDEVPEKIFDVQDMVAARIGGSVVEQLINERAEKEKQKTETEKESK